MVLVWAVAVGLTRAFGDKVDTKTSEKSTVKNAMSELMALLQDFKVLFDFYQRPRRHAAEAAFLFFIPPPSPQSSQQGH